MARKAQLVTLTAVEKPTLLSLTKTGTYKAVKLFGPGCFCCWTKAKIGSKFKRKLG